MLPHTLSFPLIHRFSVAISGGLAPGFAPLLALALAGAGAGAGSRAPLTLVAGRSRIFGSSRYLAIVFIKVRSVIGIEIEIIVE